MMRFASSWRGRAGPPDRARARPGPARIAALLAGALLAGVAHAGEQQYEELSDATRTLLRTAVSDYPPPRLAFPSEEEAERWLGEMEARLDRVMSSSVHLRLEPKLVRQFLRSVHYEATRQGLDPQLVLAIIHVESAFNKYAISSAFARGYMQVMPFWTELLGEGTESLFHMRRNLRYGTVIMRHYLDIEKGDYFRALGRYNGSLGRSTYVDKVMQRLEYWKYP